MERTLKILNEEGMHARPAGTLAKKASEFKSNIEIRAKGVSKNAKSIMAVMGMGLSHGDEITLVADGEDAHQALQALESLVNNKFLLD